MVSNGSAGTSDSSGTRLPDGPVLLAGALSVITATTGVVGGLTGAVARFLRNEPQWFAISLALIVAAVSVSFIAALLTASAASRSGTRSNTHDSPAPHRAQERALRNKQQDRLRVELSTKRLRIVLSTAPSRLPAPSHVQDSPPAERAPERRAHNVRKGRWRVALAIFSFALFVAGTITALIGFSSSLRAADSPRIAAVWKTIGTKNRPVATVSVQLSGLKTSDTLYVTAEPGTTLVRNQRGRLTGQLAGFLVYQSQTGADPDGKADVSFDVALPAGWASLQVVASVNTPRNCAGREVTNSFPAQGSSNVQFQPHPDFACITLFGPVPSAVPKPSAS
jgi:Flp pilus assembly pilin Flp